MCTAAANHSGLNSHLFVCHTFAQVCGWERLSYSSVEKNPYQAVPAAVNHCTDLKAFENLVLCCARSSTVPTMNVCAFSCVVQELRMAVMGTLKIPLAQCPASPSCQEQMLGGEYSVY